MMNTTPTAWDELAPVEKVKRRSENTHNPLASARRSATYAKNYIEKIDVLAEEAVDRLRRAQDRLLEAQELTGATESEVPRDGTHLRNHTPLAAAKREVARSHTRIRKVERMRSDAVARWMHLSAHLAVMEESR